MNNAISDYLSLYILVQIILLPVIAALGIWFGKVSSYKLQSVLMNWVLVAAFILPLLIFLINIMPVQTGSDFERVTAVRVVGGGDVFAAYTGAESGSALPGGNAAIGGDTLSEKYFTRYFQLMRRLYPLVTAAIIAGAVIFLRRIIRQLIFLRKAATASAGEGRAHQDDGVRIISSSIVNVPFSAGFLRPSIYLPSELDGEEAELIISHEKAHVRMGHTRWRLIYEFQASLFWFNPLTKIMKNQNIRLQELIADETVLESFRKKSYLDALLKWAEISSAGNKLSTLQPGAVSERGFRERIEKIFDSGVKTTSVRLRILLASSAILGSLFSFQIISCSKDLNIQEIETPVGEAERAAVESVEVAEVFSAQADSKKLSLINIQNLYDGKFRIADLPAVTEELSAENDSIPTCWPLAGKIGRITLSFGEVEPVAGFHDEPWFHPAIDIAALPGTDVTASADGVVVQTGYQPQGYGNYLIMSHDSGFYTFYAHLGEIRAEIGSIVSLGDEIGSVGVSGRSTGPHLHFAVSATPVQVTKEGGLEGGIFVDPAGILAEMP